MKASVIGGAVPALASLGLLVAASHAQAQAQLSFSGTKGVDFTVTLAAPVTYTINADFGMNGPHVAPAFVFKGVGNDFSSGGSAASGTITYSFNGGPALPILNMYSGETVGSLTPSDAYLWGNQEGVTVGEQVTLSAGSLMNFGGPLPANGSYVTYIIDGNGNDISTNGVTTLPEPASCGLLSLGAMAMLSRRRRDADSRRRP
jgi:hypothetical protein